MCENDTSHGIFLISMKSHSMWFLIFSVRFFAFHFQWEEVLNESSIEFVWVKISD